MTNDLNGSTTGIRAAWLAGEASRTARRLLMAGGLLLTLSITACGPNPTRPVTPVIVTQTPAPAATRVVQPTPFTPTAQAVIQVSPTPTPTTTTTPTATSPPTPTPTPTATATAAPSSTPTPTSPVTEVNLRDRICVGIARGALTDYPWGPAVPGWHLDWRVQTTPVSLPGTEHAQMVRLSGDSFYPDLATLRAAAQASPGALWLIGNEPDVAWQDNVPPATYATTYHTLYTAIKEADPSAQVAIGAVSQVTPLRLRYLEQVLAAYAAQFGSVMPVDVWNIHAFVLREEKDSWGVGLPPGMADATDGTLWNLEDHARVDLVAQQVRTFRQWMADHDQRTKPLIISEYGLLMPADYGFEPPVVANFLRGTFDYFAQARDRTTGYPADDQRLVQRWCWYSAADTTYPTGNLFDVENQQPTHLWPAYAAYFH